MECTEDRRRILGPVVEQRDQHQDCRYDSPTILYTMGTSEMVSRSSVSPDLDGMEFTWWVGLPPPPCLVFILTSRTTRDRGWLTLTICHS